MRSLLLAIALLFLSLAAAGADGVLEISQTCATQTGCFSGDAAGFPVTITGAAGRSYKLTSDLHALGAGTTAISVDQAARAVSVDLGGFEISCTTFVPPSTVSTCGDVGGVGIGIDALGNGVRISNGSVRGFGDTGVRTGSDGVVRDLRVSLSGSHGIDATSLSLVTENTVYANRGDGVVGGLGSVVSRNVVSGNSDRGIVARMGSNIEGNSVMFSGGHGIEAFAGALIQNNTVRTNGGVGLRMTNYPAYRANFFSDNTSAQWAGDGVNLGANVCSSSSSGIAAVC